MDFKAYSEFVLPPEKGTGIKRPKRPRKAVLGESVARPKEHHYAGQDLVLVDDDPSLVGTVETGSLEARTAAEAPAKPPSVPVAPPTESDSSKTTTSEATAESKTTAKTTATTSAKSAKASKPKNDADVQDYIISYYGQFIGHFRSSKRVTHRTAFIKAVQRLQAMVEDVDLDALELYKPVPVKFERPDHVEIAEEFRWFTVE